MKLYIFNTPTYPYRVKVKARTILEAKDKMKQKGFKNYSFSQIKIIGIQQES